MTNGAVAEPVIVPERGDRRFNANEWRDSPGYSLLKQSYLLNAKLIGELVEAAEPDTASKHRLRFYARQFVDAMSPANFAVTNPDVLKLALESKGESLCAGSANLQRDLKKGGLTITDEAAFEVGRNVATAKGSVIFENELLQLIQYAPWPRRWPRGRWSSFRRASTSSPSSTCNPRTPSCASRSSRA